MPLDQSSIKEHITEIRASIRTSIIWQDALVEKMLITYFAGWHALLEWVPGLGKTLAVKTFAEAIGSDFKRISFTPDLLPSDLTGSEIYRPSEGKFSVRKWPIFTDILLADEINRTPPKVQSALLEAMEEHQVTIGEETFPLSKGFTVFATENPIEHAGTYPLPEAELDRFMMKILLDYPESRDEVEIMRIQSQKQYSEDSSPEKGRRRTKKSQSHDITNIRDSIISLVNIDNKIFDYISSLLDATRYPGKWYDSIAPLIEYWASTRAWLALVRCARVRAMIEWRDYVLPEDIKYLAHEVLRHRIGLSYEAVGTGVKPDELITYILDNTVVP